MSRSPLQVGVWGASRPFGAWVAVGSTVIHQFDEWSFGFDRL